METALNGVIVLDLSRALAGPYTSMILADMGAEVIRVEPPPGVAAGIGSLLSYQGMDPLLFAVNRNKKSITLNLKSDKGKEVFYDLVSKGDVVLDNFRPRVPKELGIDYEALKEINPRIICCSITGFGSTGPYRDRPAYDLIGQAMSGAMSVTGEPGGPPMKAGFPTTDVGAGMCAAHGILAALYAREKTGTGQRVETSLLEAQLSFLVTEASQYLMTGQVATAMGTGHRFAFPYQAFKTKDDYIAVAGQQDFNKLCQAVGMEELARDPRFEEMFQRLAHRKELVALLEQAFLAKGAQEWLDILIEADVPCSPINTLDQALDDPQVLARDMVVTVDTTSGPIKMLGNPVKMSATPQELKRKFIAPPVFGQHTDEVLSKFLGYTPEKIDELRREKVI